MPTGWEINGVRGKKKRPPGIALQYSGTLKIVCSARCLWDDLEELGDVGGDVMAVNIAGAFYKGPVDHWCSAHPNFLMKNCVPLKRRFYHMPHETHIYTHSMRYTEGIDFVWDILRGGGGTSGMFSTLVALTLGYDKIIICGMPLDDSGHFYESPYVPPFPQDLFETNKAARLWGHHVNTIKKSNKVRSMSGMTAHWFGKPDKRWLNGDNRRHM